MRKTYIVKPVVKPENVYPISKQFYSETFNRPTFFAVLTKTATYRGRTVNISRLAVRDSLGIQS